MRKYIDLLILASLRSGDAMAAKTAFELYLWAKLKAEPPVKSNTVRHVMISQTDRRARSALIANESEYLGVRQPEVSAQSRPSQDLFFLGGRP